jgi:hypothetical protein
MVDEAFLRLSAQDRRNALGVAADRSGRPAHLLEKDVWVGDDRVGDRCHRSCSITCHLGWPCS